MNFPTTRIEDLEISRLIIGTNWFMGYSHFSKAKDDWIKSYMTVDRIAKVMCVFARHGINAVMSIQNPTMKEAIHIVKEETGVDIRWICTPGGDTLDDLVPGIEEAAEMGGRICMPHQHWTDGNLRVNEQSINGLERVTEKIREMGMIPGLSTHRPETVVIADKAGYDVATYIQIYNAIGFLCQVETDWIARVINQTPKPVICIKPLAAGRILPPTGLSFVWNSIKPIDMVCIGTLSTFEAEEDIWLSRQILSQGFIQEQNLTFSRSKSSLVG
ncbi:MAG TPA: hypothetical protein GX702_07880 [Chloroflexi bacterium]|jgi:hypothetical protein|nr:hypothetical protein [Chloroflexota bacterium]